MKNEVIVGSSSMQKYIDVIVLLIVLIEVLQNDQSVASGYRVVAVTTSRLQIENNTDGKGKDYCKQITLSSKEKGKRDVFIYAFESE